jgi:hypothetical protein
VQAIMKAPRMNLKWKAASLPTFRATVAVIMTVRLGTLLLYKAPASVSCLNIWLRWSCPCH